MHTVDLSQALGLTVSEVPAALAADGIDELLTVFFVRLAAQGSAPVVRANVLLRALDTGDEWILGRTGADKAPALLPQGSEVEATVKGTASDLYLALWGLAPHTHCCA